MAFVVEGGESQGAGDEQERERDHEIEHFLPNEIAQGVGGDGPGFGGRSGSSST